MNSDLSLISIINTRLNEGTVELPVFDGIAAKIRQKVQRNDHSADDICRLIEEDPILVADVLRMANSSFFAGLGSVNSLRDATVRLGVKQIATIVFSVNQKRLYSESDGPFKDRLLRLWQHASAVAMGSRWIAIKARHHSIADEAYVGGLLHDVGKLSLLRIIEDLYRSNMAALTDELVDHTVTQLCCTHGAQLLKKWNLPESLQTVALDQCCAEADEINVILCIVRLVDKACALEGISDYPDDSIVLESLPEKEALGLSDQDIAELRTVLLEIQGGQAIAA